MNHEQPEENTLYESLDDDADHAKDTFMTQIMYIFLLLLAFFLVLVWFGKRGVSSSS